MRRLLPFVILLAVAAPGAAFAQSDAQARACTGDALRFCGAFIPDQGQIARCLAANRRSLSPACRRTIDAGASRRPRRR